MPAHPLPAWMLLTPLCALAACTGAPDTGKEDSGSGDPCFAEDPVVEIGDGLATFTPIEAGAEVMMEHGPQGGWHMLSSVRVWHTEQIVQLHYAIDLADGTRVSDNNYRVQLKDGGDCSGTYWNMYGYLDVTAISEGDANTPPELICGQSVHMQISVEDGEGRTGSASVQVVTTPDPIDSCEAPAPQ